MPARRLPLRVRAGPVPPPFACPPHSSVLLLAPTASLASNATSPSLLYAFLAASASRAKGISRPFSLRTRGDCLADATPPISLPACAADLANVSHPLPFPRGAATDQVSQTRQSVVYHVAHADQASATHPPASHHGADAPQASATLRSALLRAANADQGNLLDTASLVRLLLGAHDILLPFPWHFPSSSTNPAPAHGYSFIPLRRALASAPAMYCDKHSLPLTRTPPSSCRCRAGECCACPLPRSFPLSSRRSSGDRPPPNARRLLRSCPRLGSGEPYIPACASRLLISSRLASGARSASLSLSRLA
ncbi:unnamed protein product [Closterium sp. NIES-64]|nr:unnamed protein product [Closterium sp. NIES-64]